MEILEITKDTRMKGKVIRVDPRGFGFISSKEIEFTRIFFYWTALVSNTLNFKELRTGMDVEFTPVSVPEKGYRAIKVKVIDNGRKDDI